MACITSVCFCFDFVAEQSIRKMERFGAFGGLKFNLLVKTGIICLLQMLFGLELMYFEILTSRLEATKVPASVHCWCHTEN